MNFKIKWLGLGITLTLFAQVTMATCKDVSRDDLVAAATTAKDTGVATGGYGLNMWVTMVDETGKVCYVVTTGETGEMAGNSAWLASRVISAQKAFTANSLSLDNYAISTANLYSAVQPGGSLYGLQHSNPVDATQSYKGSTKQFGTKNDPLTNKTVGGINVFGGGLALYSGNKKVGAIGVSGDTSCRDHAFAWRVRSALHGGMHPSVGITNANMDAVGNPQTALAADLKGDEMILNSSANNYWDAWSQPLCPNSVKAATPANGTLLN
jgi:uncharacterized protein GlcG (DUF336 family)